MSVFATTDYRKAIRTLMRERKGSGVKVNFSHLAEACRVRRPYVSKVLKGDADFNADQMFDVCEFFGLREEESHFLMLCLEYSRSSNSRRKQVLFKNLEQLQAKHLNTKSYITSHVLEPKSGELESYYLDPVVQLVHVFLGVEKYATDVRKIATQLAVPLEKVTQALAFLNSAGLIDCHDGRYSLTLRRVHLASDSPLCLPHQLLVRSRSMHRLQSLPDDRSYRFSLTFSGTQELFPLLKKQFLEFIRTLEPTIADSPEREVFQMNFDLFPWT